jgi:hypothetical protein
MMISCRDSIHHLVSFSPTLFLFALHQNCLLVVGFLIGDGDTLDAVFLIVVFVFGANFLNMRPRSLYRGVGWSHVDFESVDVAERA